MLLIQSELLLIEQHLQSLRPPVGIEWAPIVHELVTSARRPGFDRATITLSPYGVAVTYAQMIRFFKLDKFINP